MKTATRSEDLSSRAHGNPSTATPTKISRILAHLLTGASVNRFEAERLGDHCLPSTIAVLANRYGLAFQRQQERVPNNWGASCAVTRYSLPPGEHKRARVALTTFKRTACPTNKN